MKYVGIMWRHAVICAILCDAWTFVRIRWNVTPVKTNVVWNTTGISLKTINMQNLHVFPYEYSAVGLYITSVACLSSQVISFRRLEVDLGPLYDQVETLTSYKSISRIPETRSFLSIWKFKERLQSWRDVPNLLVGGLHVPHCFPASAAYATSVKLGPVHPLLQPLVFEK